MNEKDQTSFRLSFMRPVVFDPGPVRRIRRPGERRLRRPPAPTPAGAVRARGRVSSAAKTVLDVRGGLNYYKNVTSTQGNGLTTAADVGIPGGNLDSTTRVACLRSALAATPTRCSASRRASRGTVPRRPGTSRRR